MSLIRGDARHLPLVDGCVDCVVTSPPYFRRRDYGGVGQIGRESSPDAYVAELVAVFQEIMRVLRAAGTCWLNVGDSHAANETLLGIPWAIAKALMSTGWLVWSEVIWSKPTGAPVSGARRPLRTHESVFLLSRTRGYYYDADAIREPLAAATIERYRHSVKRIGSRVSGVAEHKMLVANESGRHRRSVWTVTPTHGRDDGDHFAVMPEKLVEPCILAGCPLGGLVLDPFCGSGTVVSVAQRLGRRGVGVDLSYQDLAKTRTAQRGLRFEMPA